MTRYVGLFGYGWAADKHARGAAECGARVKWVAGRNTEKADAFAAEFGAAVTDDWRAVIADPAVDIVVVATPNALHAEQCLAAIAAGKHVLVEKPVTVTVAEAHEVRAAATEAGVVVLVGHMWRYHRDVIALRDRIAAGELGTIVRTHGWGVHAMWGPEGWFVDPDLSGGGGLIDMGVHAIDTVRFLLGDPTPARVRASIGRAFGDYAVDDDAVLLIDWVDGVRSVVEAGWNQPYLGGIEADTLVLGTAGAARIWPPPSLLGAPEDHCAQSMYTAQFADLLHCVDAGTTPQASLGVGITALEIVQAAYASAGAPT